MVASLGPSAPLHNILFRASGHKFNAIAATARNAVTLAPTGIDSRTRRSRLNLPVGTRSLHHYPSQSNAKSPFSFNLAALATVAESPFGGKTPTATFSDLFCGIGAATTALSGLGLKCVFANDNSKAAANVYDLNHRGGKKFVDTRCFNTLVRDHLDQIPRADVIAAGLPLRGQCSSQPTAASEEAFDSLLHLIRHQRNSVVILAQEKRKVSSGPMGLSRICEIFDTAGYWIDWEVYDPPSFDLPICREYVIVTAVRKDLLPEPFRPPPAEKDLDKNLELSKFLIPYHDLMRLLRSRPCVYQPLALDIDGVRVALNTKSKPQLLLARSLDLDHRDVLQLPSDHDESKYAPLCPVGVWRGSDGAAGNHRVRIYHSKGWASAISPRGPMNMPYYLTPGPDDGKGGVMPCVRKLDPREAARLQGLPDSFIMPETHNMMWELVGNTMPWRLLQYPVLQLAKAHPKLFQRSRRQPPPGWPAEYPSYQPMTTTKWNTRNYYYQRLSRDL